MTAASARGGLFALRAGVPPTLLAGSWFVGAGLLAENRATDGWARGLGLVAVAAIFNLALCDPLERRLQSKTAQYLRAPVNLVLIGAAGHVSHWGLAAWIYLLGFWATQGAFRVRRSLGVDLALALAVPAFALFEGVPAFTIAVAAATTLAIYWLAYSASGIGDRVFEELEAQHQQLEQAYERRRGLQDSAIQQEKLASLGLLASGIVHEINTPMSYVGANVEALQQDLQALPDLPASLSDHLTEGLPDAREGIARIQSIVADLQIFARVGAGPFRPCDLNDSVERALRLVDNQLRFRIRVVKALGTLPKLMGRAEQLTQVGVNLLVNAAQAIRRGGTIEVITRHEGGEAVLQIRDDGSGMDEATRLRLFEPFFSTRPVGTGTGLGLSVIYGIVQAHGGKVEIQSSPGQGSCFTVRFPLEASPSPEVRP